MMKTSLLSRRTALKGLGATLALPWLEAMGPMTSWAAGNTPASKAAPNRMAFLYVPKGKNMVDWTPKAEGELSAARRIRNTACSQSQEPTPLDPFTTLYLYLYLYGQGSD